MVTALRLGIVLERPISVHSNALGPLPLAILGVYPIVVVPQIPPHQGPL